jgi:hypothetical protein
MSCGGKPLIYWIRESRGWLLIYSFATHAHHFMDAYSKGLKGKGAAWAVKKYRGHRVLLETILKEFDDTEKAEKIREYQGR